MASHGTSSSAPIRRAQAAGEDVARSAPFEWLARAGFVARGVIYGIIGILALKLALGAGGKAMNQQGALRTVAHQPFGKLLLILLAIGLGGYALWRFVRAALGHGPESSDSEFDRAAALASGLVYAGLCAVAVELLLGTGAGTSGNAHKDAAGVLGWPAGTWLVGVAGAITIGVGLYQGYRGLSKDFLRDSKTEQMTPAVRMWITRLGVYGHLARMVVFVLVGIFLIKAARDYSAKAAIGLDGALAKILHASYGPWLLGIVAGGLIAFALYSLSDARYRRI
jgi:Domain of Unknown Function (DUF1206)